MASAPLPAHAPVFAAILMQWYERHRRDLPWRNTADPYAIWVSEIMLQQTRVETVIPYYHRFLAKFPDVAALAMAEESELLAAWAGLGYYSRVRNMQRAARQIVEWGTFPEAYDRIRALPGIGDYTAAAVASIAFGQPTAVLDGNVMRVLARLTCDGGDIGSPVTRRRLLSVANELLDPGEPATFNQAMMELGATLCVPNDPKCLLCPVQQLCEGRTKGREHELPVKTRPGARKLVEVNLLVIERAGRLLLWQRPPESRRLAGFWELPEAGMLPQATGLVYAGQFQHSITNTNYTLTVQRASIAGKPAGFDWIRRDVLKDIPVSTTTRKALACL